MTQYSGFSQHVSQETIERAQSGDNSAIEEIYNMYAPACFHLANRILANKNSAQDIMQSVFIKVIGNIKSFNNQGSFAGWVRKIAVNESLSLVKKIESPVSYDHLEEQKHYETNDCYETRWWEAHSDIEKLTAKLSPQARAVLFLHEIEGFSHQEIGKLFEKSESFSKQSLRRSLQYLRKIAMMKEV